MTGYRAVGYLGRLLVAIGLACLCVWYYNAGTDHLRGLVLSVAGALGLAIPPVRQAYRNYRFRVVQRDSANRSLSPKLRDALWRKQIAAFIEFSYLDFLCLVLSPILLAVGFYLDASH